MGTVVAAMTLSSCTSDLTGLNNDPKHPTSLPSGNLFAKGQQQQFYYTYTGNVNNNNYVYFTQMWAETTYTDETNYDIVTRNQPRNTFNRMYNGVLNNYEQARKNLATEGADANKLASIEIAEISAWENIVDTFGDVPYSQALQADQGQFAPAYDDAKAIYTDLFKRINAVIPTITAGSGYAEDLVYGGDMTKWKKVANSIKLRLALNLADVDPATSKSAAESAIASGVMTSIVDSYSLAFPGGTFSNPFFDDFIASGRKDFVPTTLVVDMMNAKMDPRRTNYFIENITPNEVASITPPVTPSTTTSITLTDALVTTPDANGIIPVHVGSKVYNYQPTDTQKGTTEKATLIGKVSSINGKTITVDNVGTVAVKDVLTFDYYVGGKFGSLNPFPNYTHYNYETWLQPKAAASLLSYTEVLFMITEAAARNYNVGGGTAASWYAKAVTNSMTEHGVSSTDAATYLLVHPYDAANWKKSIGEEAYIALHNSSFAEWNFSRRLDFPVFVNPTNSKTAGVPVRMPYSDQEYVLNAANVKAAAAKIGGDKPENKLFWDKF
ncbi:SusD/RagB family nutrient-binding outer membrane lipoprotein [Halpernia sp.]|uniref:SusD/RagB family nutrient-binding outer membrane lipoprotein n=1 Tax=Halpernia sp. TaxID=2782209 RepID=UPI003A948566